MGTIHLYEYLVLLVINGLTDIVLCTAIQFLEVE
jgi:hypothetical protein